MRLHRLDIAAVGPFAGHENVDLDALAGHGIFLLTGPTGAGKTSVLDAICFALYGAVPGVREGAKRIRSDHADPDVRSRVVLELTVRGRRFRLSREPEQERPKKRGTGTTTEKAKASLEEWDGDEWTVLSTRIDEVAHEVDALVGLDREQFCQVVLLPQGDFAAFLTADATKRGELLQRLFATQRFDQVERTLAGWRIEAARARDAARDAVDDTLARLAEAAGEPDRPVLEVADIDAWVGEIVDGVAKRVATADEQSRAGRALHRRLKQRHDRARELADRQQRFAEAVERRDVLETVRAEVLLAEVELAAARRAATVLPLLAAATETAAAEASARASLAEVTADLDAMSDPGPMLAVLPVATLSSRVAALRGEVGALEVLLDRERAAATRAHEAATQRSIAAEAAEHVRAHEHWLAQHAATRAAHVERLTAAQEAGALVEPRRDAVRLATDRLAASRERDRLTAQRLTLHDALAVAVDRAQDARERLFDLRERRINGMAAELADELMPGQACPVCGSDEHPTPASGDASAVTRDDEAQAEAEYGIADQERRAAEATLRDLDTTLAEARARATAATTADLEAALTTARSALAAAEEAATTLDDLARALDSADAERDQRDQAKLALVQRAQAASTSADEADRAVAEMLTELLAARGTDSSVAARIERLDSLADCAEAVVRTARDVDDVTRQVTAARTRATKAARGAAFDDVDDAADAARDETRLAELERLIREFTDQDAAVRAQLADPTLATAAAAPAADVTEALVELDEAEIGLQSLDAELGAASAAHEAVTRLGDALAGGLAALRPLDEAYSVVAGLSRLAEGSSTDNELRMRLSSYVLAARLEQVAHAATVRLARMSASRYSLVHTDERDTHGRRSGLGLAVVDAWTGRTRPTSTLSGGETFFASLSLALGLADVVTGEAGGAPLETLFVDEGFGSLDEETLDEVMTVLDGLRDGGRSVGIVSHVAELRQRIPAQLRVLKTARGSSLDAGV